MRCRPVAECQHRHQPSTAWFLQAHASPCSSACMISVYNTHDTTPCTQLMLALRHVFVRPLRSSPAASSPRETSTAQQQASMMPFIPSALSSAPSWDVPAPSGLSATAAVARTASACMARSLPRPISGIRRTHSVALDDTEREGFVPPHLAVSMVEPQVGVALPTRFWGQAVRCRCTASMRWDVHASSAEPGTGCIGGRACCVGK